jgi:hypothetical protein
LPVTGLTGNFQLHVKMPQYAATSFSVEEYKRPNFYVEFDKISGSYKLNDSVHITGIAKAYAGNNIDGAGGKISCASCYPVFVSLVVLEKR